MENGRVGNKERPMLVALGHIFLSSPFIKWLAYSVLIALELLLVTNGIGPSTSISIGLVMSHLMSWFRSTIGIWEGQRKRIISL